MRPKRSSAALFRSPRRWASSASVLAVSAASFSLRMAPMRFFSCCQTVFIWSARSRSSAISVATAASRLAEASSFSLPSACSSMASDVSRRSI